MRRKIKDSILEVEAKRLISIYQKMPYSELAKYAESSNGEHLEIIDLKNSKDVESQIIVDCFWDDKATGNIRLSVEITSGSLKPLWGFLPLYITRSFNDFIMRPDGSLIE